MQTRSAELAGIRTALREFRDCPPVLPDIPVTVISGALADFRMSRRIRNAANDAHRHRAKQSPQGRYVVAQQSGHAVTLTEPRLVADEIHKIVGAMGQA